MWLKSLKLEHSGYGLSEELEICGVYGSQDAIHCRTKKD